MMNLTSRRSFLKRSTATAAAFSLVPGYVLGTRGQTPPSGLADKTAGRSGEVVWTWKVAKTIPAGSYAVQISAAYEGKSASQNTNLVVTAPVPAPAKPATK